MNKSLSITIIVIGSLVLAAILIGAGMFIATGHMGSILHMGENQGYPSNGYGMMTNGNGMMGGYAPGLNTSVQPLTIDQAKSAVSSYLARLNNPDLEIKEILVFSNNAYARIMEKSTGIGAMELLVNPVNLTVFPEYGPNMMWNTKYSAMFSASGGMMVGFGMMGGGVYSSNPSATMTVSPTQAVAVAQQYLDTQFPGEKADTNPDAFYGYYTIDILKDGKIAGMLSVNGFSGQIFLHTWHGTFIDSWEM